MPNLPRNLVKRHFDNPLRRTVSEDSEAVSLATETSTSNNGRSGQSADGIVIPFAGNIRLDAEHETPAAQPSSPTAAITAQPSSSIAIEPAPIAVELEHRITVRIDDVTRRALENECHRRRIAGVKTNVAEIARGILGQWASRAE